MAAPGWAGWCAGALVGAAFAGTAAAADHGDALDTRGGGISVNFVVHARHTRDIGVYDSRGLVDLKQGAWDQAIADYTQSLYYRPALSTSLYGRAVARRARGDSAGAAADMKAASASEPNIDAVLKRLGAGS